MPKWKPRLTYTSGATTKRLALLLISCGSVLVLAADKPSADVIGRWAGRKWVGDSHSVESEYSKAGSGSGVSNCAWSPDHIFVVCDQDVTDNGKKMRFLSVYAFDPENSSYHFYGMSPDGGRPRAGDVIVSENGTHWEYLSKTTIKDKPVWFRTINQFKTNDLVDWWSEYSADEGQHWTNTGGGSEKREK